MKRRVVVTGIGIVSPVGNDMETFFTGLMKGLSGVRRLIPTEAGGISVKVVAPVEIDPSKYLPRTHLKTSDRVTQLALIAASQAISDANLPIDDRTDRIAVYLGTGAGGIRTIEETHIQLYMQGVKRVRPLTVVMSMHNAAAAQIGIRFRLCGPNITFSQACASSSIAIGEAYRAIQSGAVDAVLAGGSEASLTLGVLSAWDALCTLASCDEEQPSASCRPFSRDRSGFVLGEGAAIVVLEAEALARARDAKVYAEVLGYGTTNDASHITKPSSRGQAHAITKALADAGVAPGEVDYINAHGTATPTGDVIETEAIKLAFGAAARKIPVSSTKSLHGHVMGATGAIEFVASVLAIRHASLPPTAHLKCPDPDCDLDYVPNVGRHGVTVNVAVSNSFAFGGSNAVLVAGRYRGV